MNRNCFYLMTIISGSIVISCQSAQEQPASHYVTLEEPLIAENQSICGICFEEFDESPLESSSDDIVTLQTPQVPSLCSKIPNHIKYHHECLAAHYFKLDTTCPICRTPKQTLKTDPNYTDIPSPLTLSTLEYFGGRSLKIMQDADNTIYNFTHARNKQENRLTIIFTELKNNKIVHESNFPTREMLRYIDFTQNNKHYILQSEKLNLPKPLLNALFILTQHFAYIENNKKTIYHFIDNSTTRQQTLSNASPAEVAIDFLETDIAEANIVLTYYHDIFNTSSSTSRPTMQQQNAAEIIKSKSKKLKELEKELAALKIFNQQKDDAMIESTSIPDFANVLHNAETSEDIVRGRAAIIKKMYAVKTPKSSFCSIM